MRKLFFFLIVTTILLSSCGGVTSYPVAAKTIVPVIISPTVFVTYPEFAPIDPGNVERLQVMDRWGQGIYYDAAISPDGKTLAVYSSTGIYLYDSGTMEKTQIDEEPFSVAIDQTLKSGALTFSSDGKMLVVASDRIVLWNLSQNHADKSFMNMMPEFSVNKVEFSPDGKSVAIMGMGGYGPCDGWAGNFMLYDVQSGRMLYSRYFCPDSSVFYFRWNKDGTIYYMGINPTDANPPGIYVLDIVDSASGKVLRKIEFSYQSYAYDVSSDGSMLAIDNYTNLNIHTDIKSTKTLKVIRSIDSDVIFLPETNKLLVQNKNKASFSTGWELQNSKGETICAFKDGDKQLSLSVEVYQSRFKITGNYLVRLRVGGDIQVWDVETCRLVVNLSFPLPGTTLTFSRDGRKIITGSPYIWDVTNVEPSYILPRLAALERLLSFSLNSDANQIALAQEDGIFIRNIGSDDVLHFLPRETRNGSRLVFSADDRILVESYYKGVDIWDLESGTLVRSVPFSYQREVFFNPVNSSLAIFDDDHYTDNVSIKIFDRYSGKLQREIVLPSTTSLVAFSPDWKLFAAAYSSGYISLWSVESGSMIIKAIGNYQIADSSKPFDDIAFSTDGRVLVSLSRNILRFWDVKTGDLIKELYPPFTVKQLAFSPDGRLLVTTGDDGTIRLWGVKKQP